MKSRLKIVLISLICLLTTTIYSQQDSSKMLTKSKVDLTVGMSHNYFSENEDGIFLGITLNDKFLINYNYLNFVFADNTGSFLQSSYQLRTQFLGINYIFSNFDNRFRFILGSSILFENIKANFHDNYFPSYNINNKYFTINLGSDFKLTEKFKISILTQTTLVTLPSNIYSNGCINLSIGLKYRISESKYFKSLRKIEPIKLKPIQIY